MSVNSFNGGNTCGKQQSLLVPVAVKTYLVNKGVNANVITATGKGKADPVVNCPNPSKKGKIKNFKQLIKCLQPNRRAVIEVTGTRVAK